MLALVVALVASAGFVAPGGAAASPVSSFRWFAATPAPPTWNHRALPSGAGVLSYPATFVPLTGRDPAAVSTGHQDRQGTTIAYLNATPKQGQESLSNWPTYRIEVNRAASDSVHEDGHAFGLSFRGGKGSCVIDDYWTKGKVHHYREIACFVQGRTAASVVVAAALQSDWTRELTTLERAVEAYRVT
jgi:hypothetical protein